MDPGWQEIDREITPMRRAIQAVQIERGIGASAGCFHCEAFDKECYPSMSKKGEAKVFQGDWTYVGRQYGQALVAGKKAKILFVSMDRSGKVERGVEVIQMHETFKEAQITFRQACRERDNPHMGGTDVELEHLLDETPHDQRCQQFALTNSVRCRPFATSMSSGTTAKMKANCETHTKALIDALSPDIIITQGAHPGRSIVNLVDSEIVFEFDNGMASRQRRTATIRQGAGILCLLTAHPAYHPGFAYKSGRLPLYLSDAIERVRAIYSSR